MNRIFSEFSFPLPLCLDGATGTELIRAGMPAGVCPEKWVLEHPEAILQIQSRYAAAGANAVLAPTFGANRAVLSRYGLKDEVEAINRALAQLSRRAVPDAFVGGDLSPTGKYLSPVGDAEPDELIDIYKEQAQALDPYVDFFMIETNMDLACTRMAVLGVKEVSEKPIFVTLTVTENGKTMSGDDVAASFITLSALGISAFGLNCSTGPREMGALLKPLVPLSVKLGIPLIAKPNAGVPRADGTHTHLSPEEFAAHCADMAKSGVMILGGCCGTNADYIRALSSAIQAITPSLPRPEENVGTQIANARTVFPLPKTMPEPLTADEDLADNADEMAEDEGFIYVRVENDGDADTVLEAAPFFTAPLAACGEEKAVARLARYFCGKIV